MIKELLVRPIQKFIQIESFSGILLFGATIVALIWANSPYAATYDAVWNYKIGLQTEQFKLVKPLILWINDGLMAIFFFLIGLEIKREIMVGELDSIQKASLPIFAAAGGVLIPGFVFYAMNDLPETADGWAIPMATDIAFSLAILKVLGNRVPLGLKIFLTAFAIVDDLVAVLIIAIFYSGGIKLALLGAAIALLAVLFLLSARNLYSKFSLVIIGALVWLLFLKAGIHPTIAGVLLAFTVPIRQNIDVHAFTAALDNTVNQLHESAKPGINELSKLQMEKIDNLESLTEKMQSPLHQLEHKLHSWVAYMIMPIFALSNAGVTFDMNVDLNIKLMLTLACAMVLGKAIGIFSLSKLALKLGLAKLPNGVSTAQVLGVSFLAGVGFTMAIFIANLAFADQSVLLSSAKIGVLIGSTLAGLIGFAILWRSGSDK